MPDIGPLRNANTEKLQASAFVSQSNSNELDFTKLILLARNADEDAFSRLFDFYFERLTIYLRGQLGHSDRAAGFEEDLVNESMAGFQVIVGRVENSIADFPVFGPPSDRKIGNIFLQTQVERLACPPQKIRLSQH